MSAMLKQQPKAPGSIREDILLSTINRTSILVGYGAAIADVMTMCQEHEDFSKSLDETTLEQLQWLQKELAEQASTVLNGDV